MVLQDLLETVNSLNDNLSMLGCEKQYGICFVSKQSYESYDCFRETYADLKTFIKAMEQETYFTDIDTALVEIMETGRSVDDLEYEVHFVGRANGLGERVEQDVYAYLSSL